MSHYDDSNNYIKNMFANVILQFRLEKGLSQLQAAQLSGLSLKKWISIENGEQWPQFHTMKHICKALNISQKDFSYRLAYFINSFCEQNSLP